jgi:hypothetical protein
VHFVEVNCHSDHGQGVRAQERDHHTEGQTQCLL